MKGRIEQNKEKKFTKGWCLFAGFLTLLALYGVHRWIVTTVNKVAFVRKVSMYDVSSESSKESLKSTKSKKQMHGTDGLYPMEQIDAFDEDAKHWGSIPMFHSGVTVFDANGDGRLDVYFCQDGQNWNRPTDDSGVLSDEPRYQHNALYLNQGNDERGHPIFVQIKELCRANDRYVKEEMLVENYLFPREAVVDSEKRGGRQSIVAAAADFNNDGRVDLIVGNGLPGMLWSHPKTQRIMPRFVSPTGRSSRHSSQPLAALGLSLIEYTPRNNVDDRRASSRGQEYVGANSLFLNKGDQDGDGIPEWEDISREAGVEGKRNTFSFAIADIDLDGDLDIYEANAMDFDYWPAGSTFWAGSANQIYINQLADSGDFTFIEKASAMDIDGVYDEDNPMIDYYKLRRFSFLPQRILPTFV